MYSARDELFRNVAAYCWNPNSLIPTESRAVRVPQDGGAFVLSLKPLATLHTYTKTLPNRTETTAGSHPRVAILARKKILLENPTNFSIRLWKRD